MKFNRKKSAKFSTLYESSLDEEQLCWKGLGGAGGQKSKFEKIISTRCQKSALDC